MNSFSRRLITSLVFVLALACFNWTEATTCTPGNQSKYVGLKAPLKQIKNYNESPRNRFVISGTVEIVDGCKFVVRDFKFPNNLPATWYGKDQKETEGYRIIQGVIAPSASEDKIFTLSETPGNSYDWNDFDTLTIFYKDNVYAEAHFQELEPGSNYVGSKSPSTNKSHQNNQGNGASLNQSSSSENKKAGTTDKNLSNTLDDKMSSNHDHNNHHLPEESGTSSKDSNNSTYKSKSDGKKASSSEATHVLSASYIAIALFTIIGTILVQ